jgi:hypothetical protein
MADTKPFMEENDVLKQFMELFKYAAGMQLQLAVLPYGNFIIRTVGKYGEFRLCVRT